MAAAIEGVVAVAKQALKGPRGAGGGDIDAIKGTAVDGGVHPGIGGAKTIEVGIAVAIGRTKAPVGIGFHLQAIERGKEAGVVARKAVLTIDAAVGIGGLAVEAEGVFRCVGGFGCGSVDHPASAGALAGRSEQLLALALQGFQAHALEGGIGLGGDGADGGCELANGGDPEELGCGAEEFRREAGSCGLACGEAGGADGGAGGIEAGGDTRGITCCHGQPLEGAIEHARCRQLVAAGLAEGLHGRGGGTGAVVGPPHHIKGLAIAINLLHQGGALQKQGTGDAHRIEAEAGAGGKRIGRRDQLIVKIGPGSAAAKGNQVGAAGEIGDGAGNGGFVVLGALNFKIKETSGAKAQGRCGEQANRITRG